jgi:hypothetical protein
MKRFPDRMRRVTFGSAVLWLLLAAPPAANPAFAGVEETSVQFCWALGKFDNTIYFAEVEGREDREASFIALIELSGIDHDRIECRISDSGSYRLARAELMKSWSDSEFEIVNTTFLISIID